MTGSVFVCRLIIPYGRDKANYWVYDAPKKVKYQFPMGKVKYYQFPMGKVKLILMEILCSTNVSVSIPYGKGKGENAIVFFEKVVSYQFPMGKVKQNQTSLKGKS